MSRNEGGWLLHFSVNGRSMFSHTHLIVKVLLFSFVVLCNRWNKVENEAEKPHLFPILWSGRALYDKSDWGHSFL